jgi:hypothetical protein
MGQSRQEKTEKARQCFVSFRDSHPFSVGVTPGFRRDVLKFHMNMEEKKNALEWWNYTTIADENLLNTTDTFSVDDEKWLEVVIDDVRNVRLIPS